MQINVISTADNTAAADLTGQVVVVFDVLRACSTIVTALANGCKRVIPVVSVEEARSVNKPGVILGGERNAVKIPGFTCGNSPLEYSPETVSNRTVVLTTTNGTRAINGALAARAKELYVGCILNAGAVGRLLWNKHNDVCLVCAGTKGQFSLEDTFAAGLVIREILFLAGSPGAVNQPDSSVKLTDLAVTAYYLASTNYERPLQLLQESLHGQRLINMGLEEDLKWCARENYFDFVPALKNGTIVLE
ncbi:2-phosphosulfolactate phosphatase [Desulfolucanica intricata]|uniref:2-phosphosulfolactate phosphatase n=1 Tax=Desulfolucanica intricata TaxID=1285191 RepID=UPI00082B4CDA|nr:2-phosphosulfolactate phosphatase [Desulfolucanica intricata]